METKTEDSGVIGVMTPIIPFIFTVTSNTDSEAEQRTGVTSVTRKEKVRDLVSGGTDFSAWLDYISVGWVWDCQTPARSQDHRSPTPTTYPLGSYMCMYHIRGPWETAVSPCSSSGIESDPLSWAGVPRHSGLHKGNKQNSLSWTVKHDGTRDPYTTGQFSPSRSLPLLS